MEEFCPCGKPLHYIDSPMRLLTEKIIKRLGVNIRVEIMGDAYSIPRHFIALHGMKASEIDMLAKKYNFQKVE